MMTEKNSSTVIVFLAVLCLSACTGFVSAATDGYWATETVSGAFEDQTSLAFDAAGDPCIAYDGSEGVTYAFKSGGTWHFEGVSTSRAEFLSVAFSGQGNPGISFFGTGLQYAFRQDGTWYTDSVDSGTNCGYYGNSLAFNGSSGYPAISYLDYENSVLKYAWKGPGGWQRVIVEQGPVGASQGYYNSLAFDSAGNPAISYYDETNECLKFAWRSGTTWHAEVADPGHHTGYDSTSLAFNSTDIPCIAYYNLSGHSVKFAWKSGGAWHNETVDDGGPAGNAGDELSLALDNSGNPCISYVNWTTGDADLKYAWKPGGTWHNITVDAAENTGWKNALAFDSHGNPCISYINRTAGTLKYARFVPSPVIRKITPGSGTRGTKVKVTVNGNSFQTNATVNLTRGASVIRGATKKIVVPGTIVATVKIPKKAKTGKWNLMVTNPDGRNVTKVKAFTVV